MPRVSLKALIPDAAVAAVSMFCARCADVPYRDEDHEEIKCQDCPLAVLIMDQPDLDQADAMTDDADDAVAELVHQRAALINPPAGR